MKKYKEIRKANSKWGQDSIKKFRTRFNLTQAELAEQLGCRQQTISEWELGLYTPLNAYSKLFDMLEEKLSKMPPKEGFDKLTPSSLGRNEGV